MMGPKLFWQGSRHVNVRENVVFRNYLSKTLQEIRSYYASSYN